MLNNEIILKVPAINKYKRNEKEIIMFRRNVPLVFWKRASAMTRSSYPSQQVKLMWNK